MNSHKTAIARKHLPVPVRWLLDAGMIYGNVLDYGCGKCKAVNDKFLTTALGIGEVVSYDPHFEPNALFRTNFYKGFFNVILCNYVLCTLPQDQEKKILREIKLLLCKNGVAYVSVRNDTPKSGHGVSSTGTFQRKVEIPYLYELRKTSQYRIYRLTPGRFLA